MNRKDLRALTLMGPARDNQGSDPLAVPHLNNQLFMNSPLQLFVVSTNKLYTTVAYSGKKAGQILFLYLLLDCGFYL